MVAASDIETRNGEERTLYKRFSRFLERHLPEKLYPRSLIIIVTPMLLFLSFAAFGFMERHWERVTKRLSKSTAQEIAMLIDVYETYGLRDDATQLIRMAQQRLNLSVSIVPGIDLPSDDRTSAFSLLDRKLTKQLEKRVGRPFWIDTVGHSNYVDIRVKVDDAVFRIITERDRTYASNSYIFVLWMLGTSLVLLGVAVIFLRNQIRPIQQLSIAAQSFGMGRDVPEFRPRGALEVQDAARAFINMRERIERHVEQRTAMLAGVSHDLRTMLTRFRLQLAMLAESTEVDALRADVDEMQEMLEDYMAFVRGDGGESATMTDVGSLIIDIRRENLLDGRAILTETTGNLLVPIKPKAFKRCVGNLVANACRFATNVKIAAHREDRALTVAIDDNGPGIPKAHAETVFRPFYRIDDTRNRDAGGTGLGLTIARDIARSHGGDIRLSSSTLGGLRAELTLPV